MAYENTSNHISITNQLCTRQMMLRIIIPTGKKQGEKKCKPLLQNYLSCEILWKNRKQYPFTIRFFNSFLLLLVLIFKTPMLFCLTNCIANRKVALTIQTKLKHSRSAILTNRAKKNLMEFFFILASLPFVTWLRSWCFEVHENTFALLNVHCATLSLLWNVIGIVPTEDCISFLFWRKFREK